MTLRVGSAGYVLDRGAGEAVWFADSLVTYKTTGEQTAGGLALAEVTAPKGSGSPLHRHHHEDEAWYIIEGELTFWLGDERRSASGGDFVFGPRNVAHRFRVDSTEARFLLLVTPAGFEHFTRTCGSPATSGTMPPPDLPLRDARVLAGAAERHGIDLLDTANTA
jgi:quercetin dioxygenase-like cupin family protein